MINGAGAYSRLKYEKWRTPCTEGSGDGIRRKNPYFHLYGCNYAEAEEIDFIRI